MHTMHSATMNIARVSKINYTLSLTRKWKKYYLVLALTRSVVSNFTT